MDQKSFKIQCRETNSAYFSSFCNFSDNEEQDTSQDKLAKLNSLPILWKARFNSVHMLGSVVTIDEIMVPWRGQLSFKQYVPGKAHKYGVGMCKVADINGYTYTWNFIVCTGKLDPTTSFSRTQAVTMQLLEDLFGCYRTVVADNFFTSIVLAKPVLRDDSYPIGTLRNNRVESEKAVV